MKSFIAATTVLSLAQGIFALTINTPASVVQCQPVLFTWQDGTAPYYLSLIPGGQASAAAIKTFPNQDGTSYTWPKVDIQANIGVTISLKDSTGAQAFSDIVTIGSSPDTSCLNASSSDSGSATSTAGDTSAPASSGTSPAAGATTTTAAATGIAGANTSHAATSGAPSASKTTSAAATKSTAANGASQSNAASSRSNAGAVGLAGVMALAGLVVL
ncbi:hypothetical protein DXG01_004269 [Tephrocybe rancida]|nr:hypothetical protein DXG01_004269 [Tephrocybe rancida]